MDIKDATIEELEAELAIRKAAEIEAEAIAAQVEVQAIVDASINLSNLGVAVVVDTIDPNWVNLSFDIESATGGWVPFIRGILAELQSNYGAMPGLDDQTVRVRKDKAIAHLTTIEGLLA